MFCTKKKKFHLSQGWWMRRKTAGLTDERMSEENHIVFLEKQRMQYQFLIKNFLASTCENKIALIILGVKNYNKRNSNILKELQNCNQKLFFCPPQK